MEEKVREEEELEGKKKGRKERYAKGFVGGGYLKITKFFFPFFSFFLNGL